MNNRAFAFCVLVASLAIAGCGDEASEDYHVTPVGGNYDATFFPYFEQSGEGSFSTDCAGSSFACSMPLAPGQGPTGFYLGGRTLSVRLLQEGPRLFAEVPEEHLLSLSLGPAQLGLPPSLLDPLLSEGDSVTLTFEREIFADGEGGDFFRVMVVTAEERFDADYVFGQGVAEEETASVSVTFTAPSSRVSVGFLAGLSSPGEFAALDEVSVSIASGQVLYEDFESGPAADCSPGGTNAERWSVSAPGWRTGNFCVSPLVPIEGLYSARWTGGSYRKVSGSVLSSAVSSDLSAFLGGGFQGASNLSGIFMEAWEPQNTQFFTSFSGARRELGVLVGTFRGESKNHDCVEGGTFIMTSQGVEFSDLSDYYWVMTIEGEAGSCQPALAHANTIEFMETVTTSTGNTINMVQEGPVLTADEEAYLSSGVAYQMGGVVYGDQAALVMAGVSGLTGAIGNGTIQDSTIQGPLTGLLTFEYDGENHTCILGGQSGFSVELLDKGGF